jgi:beta-glucanase (GH16 family)
MFNASFTRRSLRALSCAGLATLVLASCGGGGSDGAAMASAEQGQEGLPTMNSSTSSGATPKAASAASISAGEVSGPYGQDASQYALSFSEEFNEDLSFDVWNDTVWYESPNSTKNYAVENGALKIWPQRDESGNFFNRTIDTDGKYYQTHGYFEMEAKLPYGKGVWPAFWLLNHDQPHPHRPEIDILEAYPGGGPESGWGDENLRPTTFASTVWPQGIEAAPNAGTQVHPNLGDLSAGFHKYAVKWEPGKQTFYFDGKELYSVDVSMSDRMYILLDLWYGSASGQPDDTTPQGKDNSFEVNYVRAWTFK